MFTGVKAWHQDAQKTLEDCPGMIHLDVKWRFPFLVLKGDGKRLRAGRFMYRKRKRYLGEGSGERVGKRFPPDTPLWDF